MNVDIFGYDVWGNGKDGWEVSNSHIVDTTDMTIAQWCNNNFVLAVMISLGLLDEGTTREHIEFDESDENVIAILDSSDGRPLYHLRINPLDHS